MRVHDGATLERSCADCGLVLQKVLDDAGALSREYLLARKKCCENFCRNCPYGCDPLALQNAKSADTTA